MFCPLCGKEAKHVIRYSRDGTFIKCSEHGMIVFRGESERRVRNALVETCVNIALKEELVEGLTDRELAIVCKYYGEGKTISEIAGELGVNRTPVEVLLERAKKKLVANYAAKYDT